MKLANRYRQVNLLTSLAILVITGMAYYLVIHYILTEDLDKDLAVEEQEIVEYVKLYGHLPPPGNFQDQIVRYHFKNTKVARKFSDTEYENLKEHETEPGRILATTVSIKGKLVAVEIIKSKVEAEDLVRIIFLITLAIIVLLLIALSLVNRFVLNKLWKPFYIMLGQLRHFNIADKTEITPQATSIDEFRELNNAAISLTKKVKQDYTDLKTFTDNASHELMTPLSVINSKLDTLLQAGPFTQAQGELLEDIYTGVSRLSRLNQSLLLMAKIDNKLVERADTVLLNELLHQKVRQFQELLDAENISVDLNLMEKHVEMSKYLADILLNNLLGNAIRHNVVKGKIAVRLTETLLEIENTGVHQELNPERIFERFDKDNASDGMGLGLSIARQICVYYGYQLAYNYVAGKHLFRVTF